MRIALKTLTLLLTLLALQTDGALADPQKFVTESIDPTSGAKTFSHPSGTLRLTPRPNDAGQIQHQLAWTPAEGDHPTYTLDEGFYHEILALSPDGKSVLLTFETPERQFLFLKRRPTTRERFVALIELETGRRDRVATLFGWDEIQAKWSHNSRHIALYGQVAERIAPALARWSPADKKLELIGTERTDVQHFLPLDDGGVWFSGGTEIETVLKWGVFLVSPSKATPEMIEEGVAVAAPPVLDPTTNKVVYRTSSAPIEAFEEPAVEGSGAVAFRTRSVGDITEVIDAKGALLATLATRETPQQSYQTKQGYALRILLPENAGDKVLLIPASNGQPKVIQETGRRLSILASQPAGELIAVMSAPTNIDELRIKSGNPADWQQRLLIINAATGTTTDLGPCNWHSPPLASWSPAQTALFFVTDGIQRWVPGEASPTPFLPGTVAHRLLAIDPERIAFTSVSVRDEAGSLTRGLFLAGPNLNISCLDPNAAGATMKGLSPDRSSLLYETLGPPKGEPLLQSVKLPF